MGSLSNLRVKTKVWIGFGLVLGLLTVISVVGFLSLWNADSGFENYRDLAEASNEVGQVQAQMLMARTHAKDFIISGATEDSQAVQSRVSQMSRYIDSTQMMIVSRERDALLEEMRSDIMSYVDHFDDVVTLQHQRDEIVREASAVGPQIVDALTTIMTSAEEAGDAEAVFFAGTMLRSVLLARVSATMYLATSSETAYQNMQNDLAQAIDDAAPLIASLQDPGRRSLAEQASTATRRYQEVLVSLHDVVGERNSIIAGPMAAIGQQVADAVDGVKMSIKSEQDRLGTTADASIGNALTTVGLSAIVAMAVGFIAAWTIGTGVANPIQAMTSAMRKLASGDKSVAIPATDQSDEVGDMAKAVQIFKESMIKADTLAEEAAREQKVRDQRAAKVDSLTREFDATIGSLLQTVASSSGQMQATARSLSGAADKATQDAGACASAAEQAGGNVRTVAAAAEELAASIQEIGQQVSRSTQIASSAVEEADTSNTMVAKLADAAGRIGEVVELITTIAAQTNLLALNATIEAARAGEAGKGFAVVANEVKTLATQTAKATEDIRAQVTSIQDATSSTVDSIRGISSRIQDLNEIATTVASAVEEQDSATQEIARNVQQAAQGATEITGHIAGVTTSAYDTNRAASDVEAVSSDLSAKSEELKTFVQRFLDDVKAA